MINCLQTTQFIAELAYLKMSVFFELGTSSVRPAVELVTPVKRARLHFLMGLLLVLAVLIVYWPVYRGGFVWDDLLLIKRNPIVSRTAGVKSVWFQGDFPLSTIMFWLQWQLWQDNPIGYHIVNVLLHAFNCVLVWRILMRLKVPGAWLAAAIYGLHPVCAGSVAWISELKNTLSLMFYLWSIAFWLDADSARTLGRFTKASALYGLSLCAFVLALLSKTSTVMLPVVLLLCTWWRHNRITVQDALRVAPYFTLSVGFGLMTIWFQKEQAIKGVAVQTEGVAARIAGAAKSVWFYISKAFVPVNLNLIYPRWDLDAAAPTTYLPLLALIVVFVLCWVLKGWWGRGALFCLGFFTVNLVPVLGLIDMYYLAISRVSDHFQYIALISPAALCGAIISLLKRPRWMQHLVGLLVLVCLACLTMQRAHVFASEERLWLDVLAKNPKAWPAHNNLGAIRAEQGRLNEATTHFQIALRLKPDNYKAHINLARALATLGKFAQAESHFRAALRLNPLDADLHKFYGIALAEHGQVDHAILHLREALRSQSDTETHLYLANLFRKIGKHSVAIVHCRAALELNPDSPEALNNLAWLLATASDPALRNGGEAVQLAERACQLTACKDARYLGTLAAAYAETGRFNDAVATVKNALEKAKSTSNEQLVTVLEQLLALYQSGKPYHEPSTAHHPLTAGD